MATLIALFCITGKPFAQMSNCNVFLQGNYLEAGINWNGAVGSSTTPPTGYHSDTSSALYNGSTCGGAVTPGASIGFVADIDKDGWTTGTPNFYGDYVLPSGPQEGWSLMADGVQYDFWNHKAALSDTFPTTLLFYDMSYADSVSYKMSISHFQIGGTFVTQKAILHLDSLRMELQILIDNVGTPTVSNVFYMRTITPHNDELMSNNLATKTKIIHQIPDTANRAYVSSAGTAFGKAYLSMGALDSRAMVFIDKHSALPNEMTIDNIYAGDTNYLYGLNDSMVGNTAMGIILSFGSMPSGSGDSFNITYNFVPEPVAATADTTNGVQDPANYHYSVYPNPVVNSFRMTGLQPNDQVFLYDVLGRERTAEITNIGGGGYSSGKLIPGTYILAIKDKNGTIKKRLTLQKL